MSKVVQIIDMEISTDDSHWLILQIEPLLIKFQQEIYQYPNSINEIKERTLPNMLGIGVGSTPESDDIFIGVITAMKCIQPSISNILYELSSIKFEEYTTKKSASLIRYFLRGHYPDEIKPFTDLLKHKYLTQEHIKSLKSEIRKIKVVGASSGYNFLIGTLWQLKFYEKQRQKLIGIN